MTSPDPAWLAPALQIVSRFEGCVLTAYPDPGTGGDPWTIGYGHTGPEVTRGLTISQATAEGFLRIDLERAADAVQDLLPVSAGWGANQQAALISFVFNVGRGALANSTLRRRLLAGETPSVVITEELPRWNKGGGGVMEGLVRRRAAETALFLSSSAARVTTGTDAPPAPAPAAAAGPPVWPEGMVGPRKRPPLKPGDHHLIANDVNETLTAWTHDGRRLWRIPCLCRGQGGEAEWSRPSTDTPPGLYRIGKVYRDYEQDPAANFTPDRRAYGWYSFDLEGMEGQEGPKSRPYRDGIMLHGGGSACGWPGAWAPQQALHPTLGCIRLANADLRDRILPLLDLGTVWISVLQEAK